MPSPATFHAFVRLSLLLTILLMVPPAALGEANAARRASRPGATVTLQLKWKHQFQFAGFYAAKAKGFYRDAGLAVRFLENHPGITEFDSVLSGKASFGISGSGVLYQRLKGEPLVALAVLFQRSPAVLLTLADSGIDGPDNLAGKRIMMGEKPGSVELLALLRDREIPLESLHLLKPSFKLDDLLKGKVDALLGYSTSQIYELRQKGTSYNVIHPRDYGIDAYGDTLFTTEAEVARNPERVEAFRKASLRGWDYAMRHPAEIIALIRREYRPDLSKDYLEFEAKSIRELMLPEIVEIGYMNAHRWQKMSDTFLENGLVESTERLEGFLFPPDSPAPSEARPIPTLLVAVGWMIVLILLLYLGILIRPTRGRSGERKSQLSQFRRMALKPWGTSPENRETRVGLQNRLDLLNAVLNGIRDAVFVKDREGRYLFVNEACARVIGMPVDAIIGRDDTHIFDADRAKRFMRTDRTVFETGEPLQFDETFQKNGAETVFNVAKYLAADLGDGVGKVVGVARDITRLKTQETALTESEARYRSLFEECPVSIWEEDFSEVREYIDRLAGEGVKDMSAHFREHPGALRECVRKARVVDVNPATLALFDETEKARLLNLFQSVPSDAVFFSLGRELGTFARGKRIYEQEMRCRTRKMRPVDFRVIVTIPKDYRDSWKRVLVCLLDITERKAAERALRESENRFRIQFRSLPVPTFCARRVGESFILTDWNDAAADLTRNRIGRYQWRDVKTFIKDRRVLDEMARCYHERTLCQREIDYTLFTTGENRIIFFSFVFAPPDMVLVHCRDVTEKREMAAALERERSLLARRVAERTEELRVANANLARAARMKDEFLAGMSHELRTPLTSILGMTEILAEGIYGPLNPEQAASVETIAESATHLLALINDMLNLARIEAGKMALNPEHVSVESLCQSALGMVRQMARKKRIRLNLRIDDLLTFIRVDPLRLKQILVNLLSNGIKFTGEGGAVGLETDALPEHRMVRFTVWDTGLGIPPERIDRLFKPFSQGDGDPAEGMGLGLFLVKRLAGMHGGNVYVDSEPGKGSRFILLLPWEPEETHPSGETERTTDIQSSPASSPGKGAEGPPGDRILVVEDSPDNVKFVSDFLSAKGYRVSAVTEGRRALEAVAGERPDLILMDIQMPEMDGFEVIRRLRSDPDAARVPIIALTALAMPGDRERCIAAGADDYLSKPIRLRELLARIEALVRS